LRPLARQSYYEILDVSAEATLPELERAYRIARATYQPGSVATYSVFSDQDSSDILRRVEEAYAVLSDARMRREYDTRLRVDDEREREAAGEVLRAALEPVAEAPAGIQLELPGVETQVLGPDEANAVEPDGLALEEALEPTPEATLVVRASPELGLESELDVGLEPPDGVFDGPVLRRIRMSRGVELEEISCVTKISEIYLRFLEENRYHDLPAPVYVRGFLKEYAKCLRLDPHQVVNTYLERLEAQSESGSRRV
jgi:hypothetical protein